MLQFNIVDSSCKSLLWLRSSCVEVNVANPETNATGVALQPFTEYLVAAAAVLDPLQYTGVPQDITVRTSTLPHFNLPGFLMSLFLNR